MGPCGRARAHRTFRYRKFKFSSSDLFYKYCNIKVRCALLLYITMFIKLVGDRRFELPTSTMST